MVATASPNPASTPAISVRDVTKVYARDFHDDRTLKEILTFRSSPREKARQPLVALRDVSLEVNPGETVGIIGPNGSGKSTLLRVISGITETTSGSVQCNGRIGTLLELGAGFHDDLSGWENIHLNASIMGISKPEVEEVIDDIIDFAGVRQFIHTPVKAYSSGMYVRLGFSVAVHLKPEILLVDEVMSVGDAQFQNEGFKRMVEMRKTGVAAIFVGHNIGDIEAICDRVLWLERGEVRAWGETDEVLAQFRRHITGGKDLPEIREMGHDELMVAMEDRMGTGEITIDRVRVLGADGKPTKTILPGEPWSLELDYTASKKIDDADIMFQIEHEGIKVHTQSSGAMGFQPVFDVGTGKIKIHFSRCHLTIGSHILTVALAKRHDHFDLYDHHIRLHRFTVLSPAPSYHTPLISPPLEFTLET